MDSNLKDSNIKIFDYAPGFLMGLTLPLISLFAILITTEQNLSWALLVEIHQNSPFMWIIDLAPFIFSYAVSHNRKQSRRMDEYAERVKKVEEEKELHIKSEHSFFEALITKSPFAIVQLDINHRIITFNPAFEELFGFQGNEIIGQNLDTLIVPEKHYQEALEITRSVTYGNFVKRVSQRMKKDGSLFTAEIFGIPVFAGGEKIGVLGIYNDISAQKQTEKDLQLSERRFRSLFYDSPISLWEEDFSDVKALFDSLAQQGEDVIMLLKRDNELVKRCLRLVKILDVNQSTLELYKADEKEVLLSGLKGVLTEAAINSFRNELIALVRGEKIMQFEIEQKKMDGEVLYGLLRLSLAPGAEDTWDKVFISIIDITERKQAEEKLRYVSFHDALTGLYNRAYFEEEMSRLEQSRQHPVTIVACDLDDLKKINDTLGHDKGDEALRAAASVLGKVFRNEDVIARIGGDEFAIILPYVNEQVARKICERISIEIGRYNQDGTAEDLYRPISLSYGASTVPVGNSLIEGYKKADEQMYLNKLEKKQREPDSG
jgi:diguanylate cyclase (GGDEF)-like protein/PAS domain S-box-containing protein